MTDSATGVVLLADGEAPAGLAQAVQQLGGYARVEVALLRGGTPTLHQVIKRMVGDGAARILVIPTVAAAMDERLEENLTDLLAAERDAFPQVSLIQAMPALGVDQQAYLLVEGLRPAAGETPAVSVPLTLLGAGQQGTVQKLNGGHDFISRLVALGFTPGVGLQVIQNFGAGPLIVALRGTRIALGRQEARRVRVRPFDRLLRRRRGWHGWRRRHFG